MAIIQNNPSNQAGGGSRGEPAPDRGAPDEGTPGQGSNDRAVAPAAVGHTIPGAGTGADVSDLMTGTDGSDASDIDPIIATS